MSAPANETATPSYEVLYGGSIDLVATTFVSGISWGIMTSFYAVCMHNLIRNLRSRSYSSRKTVLLTAWVTILWILSSLSSFANAYCRIYAYSWELDYPGGPSAYLADAWGQPVPTLTYTAFVLAMWFADALWRLVIFYNSVHSLARGLILSIMFLIYIGAVGTGCFTIFALNHNDQTLFPVLAEKAIVPFFTLSVTLNVFATALITIRLLAFKRLLERSLGKKEAQQCPYTGTATMLIESSALYATWSLVFIIVYAVSSPGHIVVFITLGNIQVCLRHDGLYHLEVLEHWNRQVIAPILIVYRVSRGTAWEETTSTKLTSTLSRPVFYDNGASGSNTIVTHKSQQQGPLGSSSHMI
ncbi:hypothetical protein JVU11DRAFT_7578 [Chiua virens]|nr:hypothetical protein JVU11DRAFT_7578 [Chiua virens]